jgi:uncharacterized protein (TIGR02996 family)
VTEYEHLLRRVTDNPEDDEARLAFAAHVRTSEPERAKFIEHQIEEAVRRRAKRGWRDTNKHPLLARHEAEWTRTIAKYAKRWEFDRGFVTKVTIDPDLFLEYGDYLFVLAPIRAVEFVPSEEGEFPMTKVAGTPLLQRLDAITFLVPSLTESDLETLASSSYLSRAQVIGSSYLNVSPRVYEAFAARPETRKLLSLGFSRNFPGDSLQETDRVDYWGAPIMDWTGLQPEGHELERKFGYVPWLHPKENGCEPFDASYYVANGVLPVKPPGSPV